MTPESIRCIRLAFGLFLPVLMAGCAGSGSSTDNDGVPGSPADRFADLADDERETVAISAAELSEESFLILPAAFDTVIVRAVPAGEDEETEEDGRVVEALVKGSFPDGCTELHEISQSRSGDRQVVNLTMRRPEEAVCTQVVRPYRFFFRLDGRFGAGSYQLVLNERVFRFTVG